MFTTLLNWSQLHLLKSYNRNTYAAPIHVNSNYLHFVPSQRREQTAEQSFWEWLRHVTECTFFSSKGGNNNFPAMGFFPAAVDLKGLKRSRLVGLICICSRFLLLGDNNLSGASQLPSGGPIGEGFSFWYLPRWKRIKFQFMKSQ